ncbi:peptidyl-prolyl cis-trans isomerase C [Devosia enhydra]|uniref:Parvulin-like PPIase n=1 Tax=Devosia enhydra TaxID=665118 RepID=A0A1K2I0H9_9HYPH|nr:peptidylprolyl isomerase [Devosia enhydra]SFZ85783.1 peptidyl-prolyl cis-trans isomerase C [Devosia enhydra]
MTNRSLSPSRVLRGPLGTALKALLVAASALVVAPAALAQGTDAPANATAPAETAPAAPAAPAEIDPNAVVATVGDETITEADLAFAAEDLGEDIAGVPPAEQRAFLLSMLIDMKVMAQGAREAGMADTELFKRRLAYLEQRALYRAFFSEQINAAVTPEAVQTAYEAFIADIEPQEQVRASHILVETEDEAKAVIAELEGGRPFEEVAREKSIDPGAANGGDLGFFSAGMMVPPFSEAAFALSEPGQLSAPVQSQFGWHVIKLAEKRTAPPPSIQQVAPRLQQMLVFEAYNNVVVPRKDATSIDIPDAALAAQVEALGETEEAAAEAAAAPANSQ